MDSSPRSLSSARQLYVVAGSVLQEAVAWFLMVWSFLTLVVTMDMVFVGTFVCPVSRFCVTFPAPACLLTIPTWML